MGGVRRCVTIAAALAVPATASAQRVSRPLAERPVSGGEASVRAFATPPRPVGAPIAVSDAGRRRLVTSLNVVGGAVLGASLGYFVSQVVMSDWEGARAADRLPYRRRLALSGAAVGAVGGYLLRPRGRAGRRPRQPQGYVYIPRTDRHYLTRGELRRAIVLNALDAVERLRPEWLQSGADTSRAGAGRAAPLGSDTSVVAVYVVDTRVGGPEALEGIAIPEIEELRLYEPGEAERRWGRVHPRGAIEVVPAPRDPR